MILSTICWQIFHKHSWLKAYCTNRPQNSNPIRARELPERKRRRAKIHNPQCEKFMLSYKLSSVESTAHILTTYTKLMANRRSIVEYAVAFGVCDVEQQSDWTSLSGTDGWEAQARRNNRPQKTRNTENQQTSTVSRTVATSESRRARFNLQTHLIIGARVSCVYSVATHPTIYNNRFVLDKVFIN